ncbi:hypothetical protein EUTSA_v10000780mg [Eutrema salsugineum]|uniref:DUF4220 domain-containing protein n=1 Tax=Eutrema salsugineum TaxID=72664 RepID=V4LBC4_EUTSA|nr:uncharacterized protein LOC18015969 [Eutrema salsugineum]ESQ39682.1 hypothetical protein EUTSA_v10000780mg [Eutrema salsugineum]
MGEMIPPRLKKLWDKWNIRGVIILSLFLQTILIFFAPSRKRTAHKLLLALIWSAYLLADWAADYAVGQISDSQEEEADKHSKNRELLAFWSPFLLLHLGGPDTITALALEDNELWNRHLFSLVCQAIATVYVILLSTPNRLLTPTVIMLVGGVIKYVERTAALFSASLDKFKDSMLQKPDPGANYAKLMEEYEAKREMNMPTEVIVVEDPEKGREGNTPVRPNDVLTPLQEVQYAYKYFDIFKGLVVDLIFTNKQRDESRKFFDSLNPEEALSIIEVELSLLYDSLFTKAEILHNWTGVVFRFIALGCLFASLCLFRMKKEDTYDGFDVALTYALLICGIALDSIALLMFCVSDWSIARLRKLKEDLEERDTRADRVFNWVLGFRTLRWKPSKCFQNGHQVLDRFIMLRRWSEYIHAYNLIGYCLKIRPKRIHHTKGMVHIFFQRIIHILFIDTAIKKTIQGITLCFRAMEEGTRQLRNQTDRFLGNLCKENRLIRKVINPVRLFLLFWFSLPHLLASMIDKYVLEFFGAKDLIEEIRFTTSDRLTRELWVLIFNQVQYKHRFAEDQESAKNISSARGDWILVETSSKKKEDGSSDHAILLRFVTEKDYDQTILLWHIATELFYQSQIDEKKITDKQVHTNREFSKILSDYMMYLLIMQPTLMSAVSGIAKIRFRDTCAEANEFFQRRHISKSRHGEDNLVKEASRAILSVNTDVEPMDVKGDRSKSVLFDASVLAKELEKGGDNMWEVVSKVWVELLCFAATHCDSKEHASQLSKGGELINFVWLLMAHFGLGDQFQINRDDARAKLIVAK